MKIFSHRTEMDKNTYYINFCAYRNGIIGQIYFLKSLLGKGIISAIYEIDDLFCMFMCMVVYSFG